jgi:3-hydroxyisobutyrate dehydrogenase-like beta-hydroxyacid dehydrogenase
MAKNLLDAGATLADNAAALGASCDIMVGATKASFAKIEPVLKCCAENVFHVGEPR